MLGSVGDLERIGLWSDGVVWMEQFGVGGWGRLKRIFRIWVFEDY